MRLMAKSPRGEGAIVGWCPDKSGTPQAILITTEAKLIYAPIRDLELLNVPERMVKRIARLHKKNQERGMRELVETAKRSGKNVPVVQN